MILSEHVITTRDDGVKFETGLRVESTTNGKVVVEINRDPWRTLFIVEAEVAETLIKMLSLATDMALHPTPAPKLETPS